MQHEIGMSRMGRAALLAQLTTELVAVCAKSCDDRLTLPSGQSSADPLAVRSTTRFSNQAHPAPVGQPTGSGVTVAAPPGSCACFVVAAGARVVTRVHLDLDEVTGLDQVVDAAAPARRVRNGS